MARTGRGCTCPGTVLEDKEGGEEKEAEQQEARRLGSGNHSEAGRLSCRRYFWMWDLAH